MVAWRTPPPNGGMREVVANVVVKTGVVVSRDPCGVYNAV
jgi:hypothetical protein